MPFPRTCIGLPSNENRYYCGRWNFAKPGKSESFRSITWHAACPASNAQRVGLWRIRIARGSPRPISVLLIARPNLSGDGRETGLTAEEPFAVALLSQQAALRAAREAFIPASRRGLSGCVALTRPSLRTARAEAGKYRKEGRVAPATQGPHRVLPINLNGHQ
jgi:hypothetical protein